MARKSSKPRFIMPAISEKPVGVWEDCTSYSQNEPYPRKPRSFMMRLTPDVRVSIVSEHIYHKGQWIMNCAPWFEYKEIGLAATPDNAAEAQRLALQMVRKKLDELTAAMSAHK